jgi:hypothetical protein
MSAQLEIDQRFRGFADIALGVMSVVCSPAS